MEKIKILLGNEVSTEIQESKAASASGVNNSRTIRCPICSNEYNLSDLHCPKCKYPALSLSNNTETVRRYWNAAGQGDANVKDPSMTTEDHMVQTDEIETDTPQGRTMGNNWQDEDGTIGESNDYDEHEERYEEDSDEEESKDTVKEERQEETPNDENNGTSFKWKKIVILIIVLIIAAIIGYAATQCGSDVTPSSEEYGQQYEDDEDDEVDNTSLNDIDDSSFIFPMSEEDFIDQYRIDELTQEQAQMAINEIYARQGYDFGDSDYTDYFNQFDWYTPIWNSDEFQESWFNPYEWGNLILLKLRRDLDDEKYENERDNYLIHTDGVIDAEVNATAKEYLNIDIDGDTYYYVIADSVDSGYYIEIHEREEDDRYTITLGRWILFKDRSVYDTLSNKWIVQENL